MLNPCKERDPRVIDNALIEKCIDLQYPQGEVGRLLRLEGIPKEEVEQIRFEYLYILKIDHLWVLKSLLKLSLNNNFIEKIENLETLVQLRELDLSFNRIKKIENLDALVNLEKVTFYENYIEKIENLDNQTKLTVFSIGKNRVRDVTYVNYFRRFTALTSLNMAGNPCAEDPDFRLYVAAFLPTLLYYEYKRIEDIERTSGISRFDEPLQKLERLESADKEKRFVLEQELKDAEMHSKYFVEYLNTGKLFDTLYENDEEGKALLDVGEEVTELYEEYRAQFIDMCKEIFQVGEKHYAIRKAEIDSFESNVEQAKRENQDLSIGHMEAFLEKKEEIFSVIKDCKRQMEHDAMTSDVYEEKIRELRKQFEDLIHVTWKKLMKLEMTLFEQVEEVNTTFGQALEDMVNTFIEEVQATFTNIRAAEVTYSENLADIALRYMTAANVNPDEQIVASLRDILSDRDALNNAMTATHDTHMQAIDAREDLLVHRAKGWVENVREQLTKDELKRNRYKILEVNHFLDIQREEFENLTSEQTTVAPVNDYDLLG